MGAKFINFDEASFRLVPYLRKVWAIRGAKPRGLYFKSKEKANIFGALIDGKKIRYEWHENLNSDTFCNFVKRLKNKLPRNKKYVFILDNGPCHKSTKTMKFLYSLGKRFHIEFLPPYSPQLNAIETCWKITRHEVTNSNIYNSIDDLKEGIETFLREQPFRLTVSNYLVR